MPRLFFALQPDPDQRQAMADAAQGLLQSLGAAAVRASDLHLTLCFLGEVAEERIDPLIAAAERIEPQSVQLRLTHIEYWHRARVLCLLPDAGNEAGMRDLEILAAQLRSAAQVSGLAPDSMPFRAHVTIGRKVPSPGALQLTAPLLGTPPLPFNADGFSLMQGTRDPEGRRYVVRNAWRATP